MLAAPDITALTPVVLGLACGTMAKFGLELEDGVTIAPRKVAGHCMMLALLGLLAETSCGVAGKILVALPPTAHAVAGAGAALLSASLVRRFRRFAGKTADDKLGLDPESQP